jgi:DNA topoisomerase IA
MIKERNYLEIYKYENWADRSIPVFVNGEAFRPTELTMTSGRTQVCLSRCASATEAPVRMRTVACD